MTETIKNLEKRKEELSKLLANQEVFSDSKKIREISIEISALEKNLIQLKKIERRRAQMEELREVAEGDDAELRALALAELADLERTPQSGEESEMNDGSANLPQDAIMEIRAGAGGEEASLFAKELFFMYHRFAEKQEWKTTLLHESRSDVRGYKEVIFEIKGRDAYRSLRNESGVHRVQRIPDTEKMGRIHTSTVSVAVLPKAREVDVQILPKDIKIEFFRSSGPGGQNVNKVETAVRIYHLPTGLVVSSQDSRSQQTNRERAMDMLRSKLLDEMMRQETKKIADLRREQIGSADRSEKIRTYNFPQDRITDHRIKKSWHNIGVILEGNMEPIINSWKEVS